MYIFLILFNWNRNEFSFGPPGSLQPRLITHQSLYPLPKIFSWRLLEQVHHTAFQSSPSQLYVPLTNNACIQRLGKTSENFGTAAILNYADTHDKDWLRRLLSRGRGWGVRTNRKKMCTIPIKLHISHSVFTCIEFIADFIRHVFPLHIFVIRWNINNIYVCYVCNFISFCDLLHKTVSSYIKFARHNLRWFHLIPLSNFLLIYTVHNEM